MIVGAQDSVASRSAPRDRIELVLAQLDQLPTLSPVVTRLLSLTADGEASIRDLTRLIESDPSLTACVLRVVRRADLGVRREGMTVARAVPLLGFRMVRNAALACPFFEALSGDVSGEAASRRRDLWRHSLAVACAAEFLAEERRRGAAFLAGLLHDIGKIALDVCFPKSYARAWDRATRDMLSMCDAEAEVLGLDHTIAGKRLAARWRLEPAIVEAIWLHHQDPHSLPSRVMDAHTIRLVHLADGLARRAGVGASGSGHVIDLQAAAESLSVNAARIDEIVDALPQHVGPLCEALGLGDTDADPGAWMNAMQHAHRELARTAAKLEEANHALTCRAAVLHCLAGLQRQWTERDGAADVCAAAADAFRRLLGAEGVIVLVSNGNAPLVRAGASVDEGPPTPSILEIGDAELAAFATSTVGLVPLGDDTIVLWQRIAQASARAPIWTCTLVEHPMTIVVLVAAEESSLRGLQPQPEDWRTLMDAVRHATASVQSRREAERTAEELVDLNRRLHAAQGELARRRSLSMIAQMAGGAAHELNNPLSVIAGRAQMELAGCTDPQRQRSLDIIVEQANRASDIVSELMRFAKPEDPRPSVLSLGEAVKVDCQHWASRLGLEADELTVDARESATSAYVDHEHVREVLGIVLSNAVEATDPAARRIKVNLGPGASDETVRIRVEDNGVGMAPDVLEHVFDPFFSSRPAGRGRGLGLSRAYRLAEINGGRLWIDSKVNAGTTVTLEVPARAPVR